MKTHLSIGLLSACIALLLACPTYAEDATNDLGKQLAELSKAVKKHKNGKDMDALRAALEGLASLFEEAADDPGLRQKIVDVVGDVSKNRKKERVAMEALYVIAQLRSTAGAKYVKRHLRQADPAEVGDLLRTAIDVAGQIPESSLVAPLLKIVEKSKNFSCAASAMRALSNYGHIEKKREQILSTLVKTVKKDKPGQMPRNRTNNNESVDGSSAGTMTSPLSAGANSRWSALAPVLTGVLNDLTGQDEGSPEDWFYLHKSRKGHLSDLFVTEEETEDE